MSDTSWDLPLVTSHEAVRTALRDRRLSPRSFTDDMIAAGLSRRTAEQLTPLFRRDGDDHKHHRALLSAAFTPRSVERLRPVAAATADRLAAELVAAGPHGDFDALFATPLPPEVFAALFGLPASDRDRLAAWASVLALAFFAMGDPDIVDDIERVAAELRDYCDELIDARQADPADDLVTRLLHAEVDGDHLAHDDLVALVTGFIFAGSETTRRQLVAMVGAFAAHPSAWSTIRDDPTLIPNAVEEVLRFASIVPGLTRVALEGYDVDDVHLDTGDRMAVVFVTANMDPAAFESPETFDVTRPDAAEHLTFGWGPHYCVGAGLARVELQEALRALLTHGYSPTRA